MLVIAVTLNAWLLSFHLLSIFALVGALVLFLVSFAAARRLDDARSAHALSRVVALGSAAFGVGMVGAVVFGVWLATSVAGYSVGDGWIVAGFVLWIVIGALSGRSVAWYWRVTRPLLEGVSTEVGRGPEAGMAGYHRPLLVGLEAAATVAAVVALAVMIWKPGH